MKDLEERSRDCSSTWDSNFWEPDLWIAGSNDDLIYYYLWELKEGGGVVVGLVE